MSDVGLDGSVKQLVSRKAAAAAAEVTANAEAEMEHELAAAAAASASAAKAEAHVLMQAARVEAQKDAEALEATLKAEVQAKGASNIGTAGGSAPLDALVAAQVTFCSVKAMVSRRTEQRAASRAAHQVQPRNMHGNDLC